MRAFGVLLILWGLVLNIFTPQFARFGAWWGHYLSRWWPQSETFQRDEKWIPLTRLMGVFFAIVGLLNAFGFGQH